MDEYFKRLLDILESFLGKSKNGLSRDMQVQFACPRCVEEKGQCEIRKYNLEVNIKIQMFHCWSCCQSDNEMQGGIKKLILKYGGKEKLKEYQDVIYEMKNCSLYKLHYKDNDFNLEYGTPISKDVELPPNFMKITKNQFDPRALHYLNSRGIDWEIINDYHIGYTKYDKDYKQMSSRIIIPSFDEYGNLNYYTGRDYTNLPKRQKYFNPKSDRKNIIFNEEKVNWDEDIVLVEGPFDSICVPNSIPLLGKVLTTDFKLYRELVTRAKANVIIFLDADAFDNVKKLYNLLNHNELIGRIRYIPLINDYDPSLVFQTFGRKGIIDVLSKAKQMTVKDGLI